MISPFVGSWARTEGEKPTAAKTTDIAMYIGRNLIAHMVMLLKKINLFASHPACLDLSQLRFPESGIDQTRVLLRCSAVFKKTAASGAHLIRCNAPNHLQLPYSEGSTGGRATLAARQLKDIGFTNVTAVVMQQTECQKKGYPFVKDEPKQDQRRASSMFMARRVIPWRCRIWSAFDL